MCEQSNIKIKVPIKYTIINNKLIILWFKYSEIIGYKYVKQIKLIP